MSKTHKPSLQVPPQALQAVAQVWHQNQCKDSRRGGADQLESWALGNGGHGGRPISSTQDDIQYAYGFVCLFLCWLGVFVVLCTYGSGDSVCLQLLVFSMPVATLVQRLYDHPTTSAYFSVGS
eukprot:scaffold36561_cov19-Tisochrysis_lutea.AAC.1